MVHIAVFACSWSLEGESQGRHTPHRLCLWEVAQPNTAYTLSQQRLPTLPGSLIQETGGEARIRDSHQTQWLWPLLTWLQNENESESHSVMSDSLRPTMDCSPPGSSVHGILQARILEWVAISSSRGSSQLRDGTQVSHTAGRFFVFWATRDYRMVSTNSAVCDPYNSQVTHVGRESGVPCTVIDLAREWSFLSSLNHTFLRRAKWG